MPVRRQRPFVAGADGIPALAVVSQVHRAETKVPPGGGLADVDDRIGSFHGQDVADRRRGRIVVPASPLGIELARGPDHPQQTRGARAIHNTPVARAPWPRRFPGSGSRDVIRLVPSGRRDPGLARANRVA